MELNKLKYCLYADLSRYCTKITIKKALSIYFSRPGFAYTFWMRTTWYLAAKSAVYFPLKVISKYMRRRCMLKYGIIIPYTTRIGPGLYIAQFGTIVVNKKAVIGCDCHIGPGVTIGAKDRGRYQGVPVIGDRVYIGPGAKVIGNVHVGNDVMIGANCVVASDVPDNAVVAGVPGRVISYNGSAGYIKNIGYKHQMQIGSQSEMICTKN